MISECTDHQYSLYHDSEALVGKWFKRTGKRDEIFFSTKFGFVKGSKTYEVDSSAEFCKKACDDSLKALGIDCIDLCNYCPNRSLPSKLLTCLSRLHASCQPQDSY